MGLSIKSKRRGGEIAVVILSVVALLIQPIVPINLPRVFAASGTPGSVLINEFSANNGTDWVELYNTTGSAVDLTGWKLRDSTPSNNVALSGTVPAHGFVVVDFGTNLNVSGDTIRILDDTDVTVIDSVTYPGTVAVPAAGMYAARTTDGASSWGTPSTATKGTTNNPAPVTLTLAQRVTAANPGDTIDVTADEVIPAQIVINKPLTIKSSTGAKLSTPNALNGILGIQSNNVTIDGLTFESNFDIGESQIVRGLEISSYTGITVKNSRFLNLRQPAYINDNAQVSVIDNYTSQTKGWVILSDSNVTFSGNTWGTNVLDIAIIPAATNNYSDAQLVSLSDSNSDAVVENQFGGTKRLSDAYVTQSSNGNSGDEGSKWNPYTSIQSAVGRVVTGGTVHVADGMYTQSTDINKQVIVKAQSHGTRVIGGPSYNNAAFRVSAAGVTVEGFTIGDAAAMVGTVGVELGSSTGAVVRGNVIERNQRGISLAGASNVTVDGNIIRDNNANPENNAGIWGDAVTGVMISNNQFSGASNTSINLAGSSNIGIAHNSFTSGANAAVIWNDNNVVLEDNSLSGLSSTGFFITGTSGVTATNNTLTASTAGKSAFSISSASGAQSSGIALSKNKITGYTNGLNVTTGATIGQVQATNNWWGSATGPQDAITSDGSAPAANTSGTGVAVNGAANYSSWCLTDTCTDFFTLTAPVNLTPLTGAITKDRGFSMTWSVVSGAAVYEYRTSNSQVNTTTLGPIVYSDTSTSSNYSINGGTVTRGNSGTPDANYYWQVRAGDGSGNWSPWSEIRKVTVDTVVPTSTNDLGSLIRGTQTIRQTIGDNIQAASGKLRIWKQKTDGSLDDSKFYASANVVAVDSSNIATYTLNTATQLYGDGKYTAKFTSRDAAGNESVQEKVFTVDNTPPTVTVKAGATGSTANRVFSNVSFSLYDAYQVDKYILNGQVVDFTNNTYSDANFQNIKSKLVQGTNTFVLYDVAGNTRVYEFTYDTVAPDVPVHQSPAKDIVQSSNDFWFDWSDVDGVVSYEMQNSQNPATGADGSFAYVQWTGDYQQIQPTESKARSVGANGTWYWQVRAVDAAGNKSAWTSPWAVTIDQQDPTAISASIAPSLSRSIDTVTLSLGLQDQQSSVVSAKYTIYDDTTEEIKAKNIPIAGAYGTSVVNLSAPIDVTSLPTGTYRVQVHFNDAAGNQGKRTLYFVIDNSFVISFNEIATNVPTPTISGQAVWKTGGQPAANQIVSLRIKQGETIIPVTTTATTNSNGGWSIDVPALANGTYSILASIDGVQVGELTPVVISHFTQPELPLQSLLNLPTLGAVTAIATLPGQLTSTVGQFASAVTLPSGNTVTDSAAAQTGVLGSETVAGLSDSEAASDVKGATDENAANNWFAANWWWLVLLAAAIGFAWWLLATLRRRVRESA